MQPREMIAGTRPAMTINNASRYEVDSVDLMVSLSNHEGVAGKHRSTTSSFGTALPPPQDEVYWGFRVPLSRE